MRTVAAVAAPIPAPAHNARAHVKGLVTLMVLLPPGTPVYDLRCSLAGAEATSRKEDEVVYTGNGWATPVRPPAAQRKTTARICRKRMAS
jgi:hypothetical protein